MSRNEELFCQYEKLIREAKKPNSKTKEKPASCACCSYCRPEFKYRKCQFSRYLFAKYGDVFRKKSLRRGMFS